MAMTRPQNPSAPAPTQGIVDAPKGDPAKIPPLILGEVEMRSEVGQPAALEELGGRLLSLVECLIRFHEDLARGVTDLSDAVVDGSRAALKSKVNLLGEILEWTGAVSEEPLSPTAGATGELSANPALESESVGVKLTEVSAKGTVIE